MREPVRVLVVDDSAVIRRWLVRSLEIDPGIQVVGEAGDGAEGLRLVAELTPDVVTLDVEMPVLGGLETLRRLMAERPMPVVMVSSKTIYGAAVTLDALAVGAVDFVTKPAAEPDDQERAAVELREKVRTASGVRPRMSSASVATTLPRVPSRRLPGDRAAGPATSGGGRPRRLVVISSSTGGPAALRKVIPELSPDLDAATIVIQHMPAGFTTALAERLDAVSAIPVREAEDGERLVAGEVVVAPGDHHLLVSPDGFVRLTGLPRVNGVRPSADVTLQSTASSWADQLLAVVLTGIGADSREGARAVRASGGHVISQDEATSLIHGMPRAVADAGLSNEVLPLDEVAAAITAWSRRS